jgi:hypothetical protein
VLVLAARRHLPGLLALPRRDPTHVIASPA